MTNINLGVGIQDNTKQGLSSAYNNVTAMTNKLAKQLVLEVGIKFPDISSRVQNLEKEFRAANNAIGKFEFLGEQFDKRGRSIGTISMDFKGLKGNLSLDEINRVLPQLKDLREGIRSGAIKSVDILGIGGEEELKNLDRTIQKLTTYKETYEYVIRTANKRNTQLTSEAASIGRVNKQLEKEEKAKREIAAIDKQLDANAKSDKSEKAKLEEEVRLLSMKVKFLREQDKLAGIPQATPSAELEQTQQRLNQVKAIQRLNTLYNTQNGILTRLRNVAGQYFSLQGIIRFGQKVAEITGYYQKQQIALEGILGSATKAQSAINQLKQKALESPFMVKQLVTYTKQLAAFGIEYDNLIPTVSKLADVSVGLGVGMDRIILAYGQVKSATVLRGQELRQFTEAGIPMVEELAKKFTALNGELVTTADIFDLISKRQVSFDMVKKVMSDLTSEGGKFYKMQENITNTLAGQIEKLKDIWDAELNRIGEESGNVFTGIVKFLQQIVKNIKSVSWAMMVMIPTSYIVREFARIKMEFMKLNAAQQAQAGNMWKHAFKMGSLLRGIGSLAITAGLGIAVGLIAKAIDNATRLRKELEKVGEAFDKETTKMISGLDSLTKKITAAKIGTKEYNDAVETLATNYGDFISIDIINKLKSQSDAAHETALKFGEIAENIKEAIKYYNEYKELEAKGETSEDEFIKKATKKQFNLESNAVTIGDRNYLYSKVSSMIGREADISDINEIWDEKYKEAVREFAKSDNLSEENFRSIYKEILIDAFPDLSEWSLGFAGTQAWSKIDRINDKYINSIQDNRNRAKQTDYYKINKAFESVDTSKVTGTPLKKYAENEKAYRSVLTKEGDNTIQSVIKDVIEREIKSLGDDTNKIKNVSDAYDNLNNILKNSDKTPREVLEAFNELFNVFSDSGRANRIKEISKLYEKNVDVLTEEEDILKQRLSKITDFKDTNVNVDGKDYSIQEYLDKWNPAVLGDQTVEQTREKISAEYKSLKDKKEGYISSGEENLFKDEIAFIDKKIAVLKKIAGGNYYAVDLSDKNSGRQQREAIAPEFSEFIATLKNAYTTYRDSVQKMGTDAGLGYVRTDKQFQEMFGQFFNGIGGEKFQKLMDLKIGKKGTTTVGATIQDKFLNGAEEGILNFEDAALAVAAELKAYYESEEKMKHYRKDYLNAAKELERWVYSTISKDNLAVALEQFEKDVKKLSQIFEMTNKSVDTYRKLMEQGTAGRLGSKLGVSKEEALKPQSDRQREFIQEYIKVFNESAKLAGGNGDFSLGDNKLKSQTDILNAIAKIDEIQKLNLDNFNGTALGAQSDELKNMLKQLVDMMHQEMADISGQSVTGDIMTDAIKNIAISRGNAEYVAGTKQIKAEGYGLIDANAINTLLNASKEEAQAFFDAFMSKEENQMTLDALEHGIDKDTFLKKFDDEVTRLEEILGEIPEHLRIELGLKRKDVEDKIDKANVEYGKVGFGDEIKKYREANTWAEKQKTSLNSTIATNKLNLINAESELDELRPMVNSGDATDEQLAKYNELSQKANEYRVNIKAANDELKNVDVKKQQQQIKALNQMKEKVEGFGSKLTQLQDNFVAVFDAIKSCVDTFGKFYDMANDGENPKWIEDTSAVMGDFVENFKSAIAPILGVVAAITAVITIIIILKSVSTELMIVFLAIIAVAAIIAAVFTAIQQHDRNLEHSIEDLKKQVEEFEDAAERLNSVAERMTGIEKLKTQVDALGQSLSSAGAYAEMARLEEEKKNTDEEKVKEYNKQAFEASEEFKNGMKGMLDELIGATEDWSSAMSDAIRSAFQNGDNAARSFRASIKEMMGDVVQSMLEMAILQPLIEDALQEWTNSDALKQKYTKNVTKTDENGNQVTVQEFDAEGYTEELLSNINDPEKAEDAYNSMQNAGDAYIDAVENLPDFLKEAFKFNSDTSSLSGGISGITEDTARQLEGLANSMLMQQIIGNSHLASMSSHLIATIQISWFNGMLEQAKATRIAAENLDRAISDMRNGIRPMSVTMV